MWYYIYSFFIFSEYQSNSFSFVLYARFNSNDTFAKTELLLDLLELILETCDPLYADTKISLESESNLLLQIETLFLAGCCVVSVFAVTKTRTWVYGFWSDFFQENSAVPDGRSLANRK